MNRSSPVGMMLQFAFGPGAPGAARSTGPSTHAGNDSTMEASQQMLALAAAARDWWEAGRPEGWPLEQHLADPTAGHEGSDAERTLARAVAHWVKQDT